MVVGERVLEYNCHNLLVIPVELPLVGQVTEASVEHPYLCMRLDLDPGLLAEQVGAHTEGLPPERETGPGLVELTEEFANACRRLVACLDSPQESSWLAPLVSREIHGRLLAGEASALARQIAIGSSSGIGRATAWIKSHLDEPVSVAGLAHIAGMSRSAFHRHFLSVTGLSPLKYQQRMRLLEARRLMVASGAQAGTAAFAVGYGSATQFSREYARMFEAPPARDARNLREGVAGRARIARL